MAKIMRAMAAATALAAGLLIAVAGLLMGPARLASAQTGTSERPAIERPTVERLLADGWEVAGFVAVLENRTLVLLKHKERPYLVQCSVLIDIMRTPRVLTACYEIR